MHILDLLELTGSQPKAARALSMHQSTVSRSAALICEQFRLQAKPGAGVCRYGTNESLQLLRQSYRAHRLMDGQLRIATDPLHQQGRFKVCLQGGCGGCEHVLRWVAWLPPCAQSRRFS